MLDAIQVVHDFAAFDGHFAFEFLFAHHFVTGFVVEAEGALPHRQDGYIGNGPHRQLPQVFAFDYLCGCPGTGFDHAGNRSSPMATNLDMMLSMSFMEPFMLPVCRSVLMVVG